jgi:D-glycero-alpha-D-manno-heptose-7-phosphate kinase
MIISRTPFRISFFGGGTDYPVWYEKNGGMTISTTINKYAYITVRELPPFFNYKHRIQYHLKEEVNSLEEIKHPVVREATKLLGVKKGIEMVHNADLPARSGLGSSSTFTVGFLQALYAMKSQMVTKRELALKAINLEQNIIGEAVGSQDQTIAAFGGFNLIEFNKSKTFQVQEFLVSEDRIQSLQQNLLLCFTGFARTAQDIAKSQIEITPFKEKELNMMMKITEEAKKIIYNNKVSIDEFGKLLNEQWLIKKNLTKYISNKDIDNIYEAAMNAGAIGGKLLGAGGGGFILLYAKKENHLKIKEVLKSKLFVPFKFEKTGSQIIYFSHDQT